MASNFFTLYANIPSSSATYEHTTGDLYFFPSFEQIFPNISYEGHTFSHWNSESDGSGTSYFPGDSTELAEPTQYAIWVEDFSTSSTKYWVTDTQLQMLADAIRAEGETAALLTYPDDFITAIDNLSGIQQSSISANWPTEFNNIYWTTAEELESIADTIRAKNNTSETLTYLEDFINSLTVVQSTCNVICKNTQTVWWDGDTYTPIPPESESPGNVRVTSHTIGEIVYVRISTQSNPFTVSPSSVSYETEAESNIWGTIIKFIMPSYDVNITGSH